MISDGAGGLINAAETSLARQLRQRCLIHRARNVLAKVPEHAQAEVKAAYWAIFDTDDLTGGEVSAYTLMCRTSYGLTCRSVSAS